MSTEALSSIQTKHRQSKVVWSKHRRIIWPEEAREQRLKDAIASSVDTGETINLQAMEPRAENVVELSSSSDQEATLAWWPIPPAAYFIIPMVSPQVQTLDGDTPDPSPGAPTPETGYAVVELVISNFTKCSPPEVRIYDDEDPGSEPYFVIEWAKPATYAQAVAWGCFNQYSGTPVVQTETTPMPLTPDPNPGLRSGQTTPFSVNHVPLARRSRIELYHWHYDTVSTSYITLEAGTFVAPVFYHDVNEGPYDASRVVERLISVSDIFWHVPDGYPQYSPSANDILGQANIQMHLVGTGIHVLSSGENNNMETTSCSFDWDTGSSRYNVDHAVDLYSIETFTEGGMPTGFTGWGGGTCRSQGQLAVKDTMYEMWDHHMVAIQVDHELGHYLGKLPHYDDIWGYLMNTSGQGGHMLTWSEDPDDLGEVQLAQQRIAGIVFSDPSLDFYQQN